MKAENKQAGFTMVETLIVLAIMGFLFVSTTLLVQGQIVKYQQRDAILQLESLVTSMMNDVANGYYPDVGSGISCTASGVAITAGPSLDTTATVGTNKQCVYAGKKITFNADDITVDTLAASEFNTSVPNPTTANVPIIPGLSEKKSYRWGITPTSTSVGKVIYILNTSYGVTKDGSDKFLSGVQNVVVVNSSNTVITTSDTPICFENGNNNSSLAINGSGSLQVTATPKSSCT